MALWIVTNDWQGYAHEGVIVEAADADEALAQARKALTVHWLDELYHRNAQGWEELAKHAVKHLDSYKPSSNLRWDVKKITLPHIGEF